MKTIFNYISIVILGLFMYACSASDVYKDDTDPNDDPIISFDWKMSNEVTLQVSVPELDNDFDRYYRMIRIFTDASMEPNSLIGSGMALSSQDFTTALSIPKAVQELYISVKDATGRQRIYQSNVTSSDGTLFINTATAPEYTVETRTSSLDYEPIPVMQLPEDYIVVSDKFPAYLEHDKTYLIPKGVTVTVEDTTVLSNKNYTNRRTSTIFVEGTMILKERTGTSIMDKHIVVMSGGKIEAERFELSRLYHKDYDVPVLYVMEGGYVKASLLAVQGNLVMVNKGIVECATFRTYKNTKVYISGRLTATTDLSLNWIDDNYVWLYPNALLEGHKRTFIGKCTITMYDNAIVYLGDGVASSGAKFISLPGEGPALVRMDGSYASHESYTFDGPIEVFIPNLKDAHIDNLNERMSNGAYLTDSWETRQVFIPESDYNKGYGEFTPIDKDGDGVPNVSDLDDEDSSVAQNSFYPSETEYATVMFEDLWPNKGDYDMNDIVANIQTEKISNTQNEVVELRIKWKLKAAGTTKKIAMGIQLDDISTAEVKSVSRTYSLGSGPFSLNNGLETGQSKAVVPLFNSVAEVFNQETQINVSNKSQHIDSDTETIRIVFNSPVNSSKLTEQKLNIFIVVSEDNATRDQEVHLPGFKITDKGKVVSGNELLNPNDNFLSSDGMMWGFIVPKSIAHTVDGVSIEDAYTNFKKWYMSNGVNYTDWYMDKTGYQNKEKLYEEPAIDNID